MSLLAPLPPLWGLWAPPPPPLGPLPLQRPPPRGPTTASVARRRRGCGGGGAEGVGPSITEHALPPSTIFPGHHEFRLVVGGAPPRGTRRRTAAPLSLAFLRKACSQQFLVKVFWILGTFKTIALETL